MAGVAFSTSMWYLEDNVLIQVDNQVREVMLKYPPNLKLSFSHGFMQRNRKNLNVLLSVLN